MVVWVREGERGVDSLLEKCLPSEQKVALIKKMFVFCGRKIIPSTLTKFKVSGRAGGVTLQIVMIEFRTISKFSITQSVPFPTLPYSPTEVLRSEFLFDFAFDLLLL